jgi:crotonobetainyl-CoA:carnitine CoA-transferase CaiB-like acyl-CoA transferase
VPGPLEGLFVVDASWGMPGSVASMLLADYGAEVLKVERPGGGPDASAPTRRAWDRGKGSVEIDLNSAEGRSSAVGLLAQADIFIESFGPAMSDYPELRYSNLRTINEEIIVCSISGYGRDSPWRDRPGYDALVAARMGLMAEQDGPREGPHFLGHPSIGYATAFMAVIGVLAAVRARTIEGVGQEVQVSLLDGVLACSTMNWWWNEKGVSYLARTGTEKGFGKSRIITDLFQCADDEWLIIHTGGTGGFKRTMDLLGLGDAIRDIPGLETSVPLDDEEYYAARTLAPKAFRNRPRDEWIHLFHENDLAALPVLRQAEVLNDSQVEHARVVVTVDDPEVGKLRQVGPCFAFADSPAALPKGAPRVGQDNARLESLLDRSRLASEKGLSPAPLRFALEDLKVIDFSTYFAAPYGARILSDLGASVIKVEATTGDLMRPLPDPFEGAQRGKQTIALDLKRKEGLQVALGLIAEADVVMHNFRPGKAEKLGIDYEATRRINPEVVYCYLPGFGSSGPKSSLKSFAPLLSGFVGNFYEGAGRGMPPVRRVMGNEDYYNGLCAAMAVLMGVRHRSRTGRGQYIESPQLHSALLSTTHNYLSESGETVLGLELVGSQYGWSPLYRLYETGDGWLCLACVGSAAFAKLCVALDLAGLAADIRFSTDEGRRDHAEDLHVRLEAVFAGMSTTAAIEALEKAGVPCEIPLDHPHMPDLLWEEWALESGTVFEQQHPTWGWIREIGHMVRLSSTPGARRGAGPLLGADTREILSDLRYSADEIAGLLLSGVCVAADPPAGE